MNTEQRGSTIMLVTGMLAILGIIALFLIYRSETEWAAFTGAERSLHLKGVAEQVLYEQVALLLKDEKENDTKEEDWYGKTGRFESERDGCTVTVLVEDEGSKPNLNLVNEAALRALLPKDSKLAVAPVLDWLDIDQKELEDGAEIAYYEALKPPYKPRDGFCASLQEILQMKGGRELYPYLAPVLTVYGKLNINVLTADQFGIILEAAGFDKFDIDTIKSEFQNKMVMAKIAGNFEPVTGINILGTWSSFNLQEAKKLIPFINFTGSSNVNMMSFKELKVQLILWSQGQISNQKAATLALKLVTYRQSKPIESVDELKVAINDPNLISHYKLEDYFTVSSSIIRYRVWVVQGERKYYLNTVQERIAGDLQQKWRVRTLAWQVLTNKNVPKIPKPISAEATTTPGPEATDADADPDAESDPDTESDSDTESITESDSDTDAAVRDK